MSGAMTEKATVFRCDCGWGEDVFSVFPSQHRVHPQKPLRMDGRNPERCVGDFASVDDARKFLTETMHYRILEEA